MREYNSYGLWKIDTDIELDSFEDCQENGLSRICYTNP